jgi:RimJ/RimL family protein N-acetyltransferase
MMKAPEAIETARLILRRPRLDDAPAIFERYANDPEVTRYLGWARHQSIRDTEAFLQFSVQEWERWPAGPYLIITRTGGQLIGSTGLGFQAPDEAVTGYVLAKDAWGKGYATEALAAMIDAATRIGVTRLCALCHPEHRPSRRVLEKCGFMRDHVSTRRVEFPNLLSGIQQEALCYALTFETGKNHAG